MAAAMLEKSIPIVKAAQIKEQIKEQNNVDISNQKIRKILKNEMCSGTEE